MKEKIISISFVSFLSIFFILNLLVGDISISENERRKLKQFPNPSIETIMDRSFMEDFDAYTLDQFVGRNIFRSIKANANYMLFKKLDNNGIYIKDDYIFKSEYPTNVKSIHHFITRVSEIGKYFSDNNKVYYAIVPDKNYYVDDSKYLNIDYDLLYKQVQELPYQYIELRDVLELNDYYKTDTHWKQQNLKKVVNRLGSVMNFQIDSEYQENKYRPFYGVYYGQAALNKGYDELIYLTNDTILNSKVTYLEDSKSTSVYPLYKLDSLDKYDIFLGGASSFIEIENPKNQSGRELVIFRDSYASSLTPLLIDAYSKITLIDTRYITSDNYLQRIEFKDQDVLFLYSTLIINNSASLKK